MISLVSELASLFGFLPRYSEVDSDNLGIRPFCLVATWGHVPSLGCRKAPLLARIVLLLRQDADFEQLKHLSALLFCLCLYLERATLTSNLV